MKISPALRERFLISVDDYGIRRTSTPILQLAQKGILDRVAVMVKYVSSEEAEKLLATGVKIDIHLDLIHLLGRGDQAGEGALSRGLSFALRYFRGQVPTDAVERAWRIQIEKFRELFGRLPDGLNSHEHIHYFPRFFPIFVKLAQEYTIPYIRFGRREMLLHLHASLISRILTWCAKRNQKLFEASGLSSSDYLVGFDWLSHFDDLMHDLPAEGTIELVFHPERDREFQFLDETF